MQAVKNQAVRVEVIADHILILLDNMKTGATSNTMYWLYQVSQDVENSPGSVEVVRGLLLLIQDQYKHIDPPYVLPQSTQP